MSLSMVSSTAEEGNLPACEAFEVPLGNIKCDQAEGESLQGAFSRFRKRKKVS